MNSFSNRLRIAMDNMNINLTKLSKLTNISKPLISNYLSGNYKAKQDNIYSIARVLNVNPSWLMGLDVPMEREFFNKEFNSVLNFGFTLFELLRYYKISKEELANRLDIDINTITKAISGEQLPNDDEIQKIADYFNIKEKDDLFDNTTYNKLRENYFESENVPEDKYRFGFELESMFEKISEEINQPLDELKQIFMNKNNRALNNRLKLTYDNLKDFFINYFESQKKPLDELDILFSKHKDILTDEDKEYMRFIIEKRKKEIDKQLGED